MLSTGHVDCSGLNEYGELGDGTTTGPEICIEDRIFEAPCSKTPVEIPGINDAAQVAATGRFICALMSGGSIECWGLNYDGELGNGEAETSSDIPVDVQGINDATEVTVKFTHTCALLATGRVDCWGEDGFGQQGNGSFEQAHVPVEVSNITNATEVSAGGTFTCALLATGHVDCWGENRWGQLGNDTTTNSDVPVEVQDIDNATKVSAGEESACAVLATGHVDCWGNNEGGQPRGRHHDRPGKMHIPKLDWSLQHHTRGSAGPQHRQTGHGRRRFRVRPHVQRDSRLLG